MKKKESAHLLTRKHTNLHKNPKMRKSGILKDF